MILVDTNVLLDVVEDDPAWVDWSQQHWTPPVCVARFALIQ